MIKRILLLTAISLFAVKAGSQPNAIPSDQVQRSLTLDEVVAVAKDQSIDAMVARHGFLAAYWQFRSHKAELLPSLTMNLTLPNFSRQIVEAMNYETGEYNYVSTYSMRNSVGLSVNQNIAATGGRVSVYSSLERLDQYAPSKYKMYNSQPVSITYTQPIFGTFNSLKWDKKIEPERYDRAKFTYLESMEAIAIKAVDYSFQLILAQQNAYTARQNFENTKKLYEIALERFKIGSMTQNQLLQLELQHTNDGLAVNQSEINLKMAKAQLNSYLGYNQTVDIALVLPENVMDMELDIDRVFDLSVNNTSFAMNQKISVLEAERAVAQARANRGIQADLYSQIGLNQSGSTFADGYRSPKDQEMVRLGIQFPILDWGMGRGRVRMAQSQKNVVDAQVEQQMVDQWQNVMLKVLEFNSQRDQCALSERANAIAQDRYEIATTQFTMGALSVTDFNVAQSEKDNAMTRYISELQNYWNYYFTLQKLTLYDFINKSNISADFDRIIEE